MADLTLDLKQALPGRTVTEMLASGALLGLAQLLSPGGRRSRLSVLLFHRILAAPDPLQPGEPTAVEFEQLLRQTAAIFRVIPLAEGVRGLRNGDLPSRSLAITFDDGYADNHDLALPVLRKLGLPATFFVATGYLDGGIMFNDVVLEIIRLAPGPVLDLTRYGCGSHALGSTADRLRAMSAILSVIKYLPIAQRTDTVMTMAADLGVPLRKDLMMSSGQTAALAAQGMEVGAHTTMHPILASERLDDVRREITVGRERLESITGKPVKHFAYPNGVPGRDYQADHVRLVRELGFDAAVSTARGVSGPGDDVYQIRRFTPWDRSTVAFGARLALNLRGPGVPLCKLGPD